MIASGQPCETCEVDESAVDGDLAVPSPRAYLLAPACLLFAWYMKAMSDGDDLQAPPAAKASLKQRLSALFGEYGQIAIITYFALSMLAIIGFSIAIGIGWQPSTSTGVLGVILAGWVAAKATLPIRILVTLGLTPVVAFVVTRVRRTATVAPPVDPPAPDMGPPAPDVDPQ